LRLIGLLVLAGPLLGCSQEDPPKATPPSPSVQEQTTINVKVWKSSGSSETLLRTLVWSFDHVSVLTGEVPALGGLFDVDIKEELFRIEISSSPESYPVGRGADDKYHVFSRPVGSIHRIRASETNETILEEALTYLKGQTQWELYKSLESRKKGH
jgi:hypothetical protein